MDYSWSLFLVYMVASFGVLKSLTATSFPNLFVNTGLCLLSGIIADTLVKLMVNTLPRKLLPDLTSKAVLVTGCDTGFGHLCARSLDALGVTVFAGCLMPDGPGASELKAAASSNLHVVTLDVTSQQQVNEAFTYVQRSLNGKDLWAVINNAGIGVLGEVDWCPVEILQQVMDVNMLGVVRVTKAFLPMIKKSKGRIVCLSSTSGRITSLGMTYYCMSKSAVQSFVDGLRVEMKKWSVAVIGIEPNGYTTSIISDKNIMNMVARSWEMCPKNIQSEYGKEYIDACEESLKSSKSWILSDKLQEVIEDMVDAAVGLTPKMRYVPGFLQQVIPRVYSLLPADLADYAQKIFMRLEKLPAALEAAKK